MISASEGRRKPGPGRQQGQGEEGRAEEVGAPAGPDLRPQEEAHPAAAQGGWKAARPIVHSPFFSVNGHFMGVVVLFPRRHSPFSWFSPVVFIVSYLAACVFFFLVVGAGAAIAIPP